MMVEKELSRKSLMVFISSVTLRVQLLHKSLTKKTRRFLRIRAPGKKGKRGKRISKTDRFALILVEGMRGVK
jgi:hypothetical protein